MLIVKYKNTDMNNTIHDLERSRKITLPLEYKDFIDKYNGGYTPETSYRKGNVGYELRAFYGLGDTDYSLDRLHLDRWINRMLFPIACDSFGNFFCLSLSSETYGELMFEDHEMGGKCSRLSITFRTFIENCKSKKIDERYTMSIKERENLLKSRGKGSNITDGLRNMWQAEIDKYKDMQQIEVVL